MRIKKTCICLLFVLWTLSGTAFAKKGEIFLAKITIGKRIDLGATFDYEVAEKERGAAIFRIQEILNLNLERRSIFLSKKACRKTVNPRILP